MAGVGCDRKQPLAPTEEAVRLTEKLERSGFCQFTDDSGRLVRAAYPEQILKGSNLQDQADSLASWVVGIFHEVTEAEYFIQDQRRSRKFDLHICPGGCAGWRRTTGRRANLTRPDR